MIQQACKYVSSSLWPCLAFFKLKITNILKSSRWGLVQSGLPWEQNFYLQHKDYLVERKADSYNGLSGLSELKTFYLIKFIYTFLLLGNRKFPRLAA